MNTEAGKEPSFLSREEIDALHRDSIDKYGGDPGLRNEDGLESAIAQPQQVHHYTDADHYEIAGAYAYHIAENQPYVDGNKRTAMAAATAYLETNGIDTSRLPEDKAYDTMIGVSAKEVDRQQVGDFLRSSLEHQQERAESLNNAQTSSSVEDLAASYAKANPASGASTEEHMEAAYFAHAVEDLDKYPPRDKEMRERVEQRQFEEQFEKNLRKGSGETSREESKQELMQERMQSYMDRQKQYAM